MSPIKWLNYLIFMENVLGIYRNYDSQKRLKKRLITTQLLVQNIFHFSILFGEAYFLLTEHDSAKAKFIHICFSALTYLNSVSSVITGVCYNRAFLSYLGSVTYIFNCFKDDEFDRSLKKLNRFSIIFTTLAIVFSVYRAAEILINYVKDDGDTNLVIFVSVFVSQALIRITIVFQKVILFVRIMVVVNLIKCMNSMISAVHNRVGRCVNSPEEQCDITREKIQGWVEMYRHLVNCSEKLTLCFGRQFIFSIIVSMIYYMLLTNHMCNKNVPNKGDMKTVFIVLSFVTITILPIYAGQLMRNQGTKFHILLARLYNTMIIIDTNEAEAKSIKDLMRLIKKNPIEIKLLSNFPAGMYLLPVLLSLAVNYVIVILQFNNVI